jgi:hypothetical protein
MSMTLTRNNIVTPDGKTLGTGQLIQTAFASSGPVRQTINSLVPVAVTGLSISFTPLSPTSTIFMTAFLTHSDTYVNSFGIYKDGNPTVSTAGFTNTSAPNSQVTQYQSNDTTALYLVTTRVSAYDTAGSTTARTYAVYGVSEWSNVAYALYINNRAANDMASFSYMYIFEYETN